jgi:hypothetical protein
MSHRNHTWSPGPLWAAGSGYIRTDKEKRGMCSKPIHWSVAIVVTVLSCVVGGCGGSLLDSLPAVREPIPTDVLRQLTAGDLADAFDQFRTGTVDGIGGGQSAGLSDEQRAAIEELQRQLDAGEVSEDEFIARVAGVLQDTAPNSPFAGFRFLGSPFGAAGTNEFADLLGLTQQQREQGLLIYDLLHAEIADVREAAKDQMRAVLSAQQRVILDELSEQLLDRAGVPEEQRAGARLIFDLLVLRLGLTFDQQAQLEAVREGLRATAQELHTAAREEFLGLLNPGQLASLPFPE